MHYKVCVRKDKLKNLIIWITKPPVPQGFIKTTDLAKLLQTLKDKARCGA